MQNIKKPMCCIRLLVALERKYQNKHIFSYLFAFVFSKNLITHIGFWTNFAQGHIVEFVVAPRFPPAVFQGFQTNAKNTNDNTFTKTDNNKRLLFCFCFDFLTDYAAES